MTTPHRLAWLLTPFFLLLLTPAAAAGDDTTVDRAVARVCGIQRYVCDPGALIRDAIRTVFAVLGAAVEAVFYWLGWPWRFLYGKVGDLFTNIGALLNRAAFATVTTVLGAFASVTQGLTAAVPLLGPVAPLFVAVLFGVTGYALMYLVLMIIKSAKTAVGTYFAGGIIK